jgi:disulfide bond formation protein DsbB
METPKAKYAIVALALAVVGTLGSLYLSIGMGLKACPLCFYQRSFIMAILAVLLMGLIVDRKRAGLLCLLCLPLSIAGLGVAVFHENLVLSGKLECPSGAFGLGTAPLQSAVLFVVATISLALGIENRIASALGGVVLGLALALGCVASAPPVPPAPDKPYESPPEICRPSFRSSN